MRCADETYVRVHGRWCYLYRAVDSTGATIDFLLSALRDFAAAQRLFRQALYATSHPQPRVSNTDKAPLYCSAIHVVKSIAPVDDGKGGALYMIRKAQARWVSHGDVRRQASIRRPALRAGGLRSSNPVARGRSLSVFKVATHPSKVN